MDGLVDGSVTLAFRRWAVPRVKVGTRTRSRVGIVEITAIDPIADDALTRTDAAAAGFTSLEQAQKWVAGKGAADGQLFRIGIRLAGPDTRIELRNSAELTVDDRMAIRVRLGRLDKAADTPWTWQYLELIEANPAVLALDVATSIGMERDKFKRRVRQLKELGLTESLEVGYRISPRGETYLRMTRQDGEPLS